MVLIRPTEQKSFKSLVPTKTRLSQLEETSVTTNTHLCKPEFSTSPSIRTFSTNNLIGVSQLRISPTRTTSTALSTPVVTKATESITTNTTITATNPKAQLSFFEAFDVSIMSPVKTFFAKVVNAFNPRTWVKFFAKTAAEAANDLEATWAQNRPQQTATV